MDKENNKSNSSNIKFSDKCLFTKVVPSEDPAICTNLNSVASFRQGLFDTSALDLKCRDEILEWLDNNKDIIDSIECFLLKHPLFEFPLPLYPMFQFVHHSQLGFIFKDKNGKQIRHLCLQLQNSWWPPVSSTVPFNLAQPCKLINEDGSSKIVNNLVDKTAIFAHFLEPENYTADRIVEMNRYVYFRGINNQYLGNMVSFNFFLESYRVWRMQNTAITEQEYDQLLSTDRSKGLLEKYDFEESYGQDSSTTEKVLPLSNKPRLKGTGDGKLFIFSGFSPAYWSINEGTVLHYATIKGDDTVATGGVSNKFQNLINWTFNNLQCYDNPYTHFRSYSKNYITLSTSALSIPWISSEASKNKDPLLTPQRINSLSTKLRGNNNDSWSKTTELWDDNGDDEKTFDAAMKLLEKCRNIGQLAPKSEDDSGTSKFEYDYTSCPLVVTAGNYNCEIFSSMIISLILNTDTFNTDGIQTERKFNFNFPGAPFIEDKNNKTVPSGEKYFKYKGPTNENSLPIKPDADYTLEDGLMRMYSAYWPVAVYDDKYENGILESEFNNSLDPSIIADREEYGKQSMIFQSLFNGLNIQAAEVTGNPILEMLAETFSLPLLKTIIGGLGRSASTMAPILNNIMYILFLYEFLGAETVFLAGYRANNIYGNTFKKYDYFDCEPAIYKFKIGRSTKRGTANSKLLASLLKWILSGQTHILTGFKLFKDAGDNLTPEQQKKFDNIKKRFTTAKDALVALEPQNWPDKIDCDAKYPVPAEKPPDCSNVSILKKPSCEMNKMNYEIQSMKNTICKGKNTADEVQYGLKEGSSLVINTVDGFVDILKLGGDIPTLLKELANFLTEKAIPLINSIAGSMTRFTNWCHQNYELNPNIMTGRYANNEGAKVLTGKIGNLRRPDKGICSSLSSCALSNYKTPSTVNRKVNFQTIPLKKANFKLTNPYKKHDTFFILFCIIISLAFIGLWVYLILKIRRSKK